jgi:PHD-finger
MPIDFNFRRKIIQNDHCYTPLNHTHERPEKVQPTKSSSKNVQVKTASKREQKPTLKSQQQVKKEESSESDDEALEDDEEYEEEQSENEQDISFSESDDDNDMDFSVNDRFGKKGKKKRKYRKHKQKQKDLTFKDFLETGDVPQTTDEPKKKYLKTSPKKVNTPKPSTSGKIVSSTKNVQPTVTKKSFLSQPVTVKTFRKEPAAQFVPLIANPLKSEHPQLPRQISVQSSMPMKSKQEIEFVASIVKDLEKSFPEPEKKIEMMPIPTTVAIPNIMQMMETNTSAEIIDQSLSTLEQLDPTVGSVGMEEIGDAIIAVLGNEAIDEILNQNDLINFDTSPSAPLLKLSQGVVDTLPQFRANVMVDSPITVLTSDQMPKILNKQASGTDPIKVVRNGRVITLPPIEAPTTRGAKRRAQGDSPNSSITSPSAGKHFKVEKTPSSKDPDSRNSSRRSSLNKSESGKSSRRQSFVQNAGVDDDLDDLNSDGSWASEDDPDRLWCICKQPHNNRFMICCDKCEDWFHGKCVNVTRKMESEMQGKEWRCPNCKAAEGNGETNMKTDSSKKQLNQQKLTKFFAKSQKESTDEDVAQTKCVVCRRNLARESSIYCSDECIRNHATKHLDDPKTGEGGNSAKRGNVLKDKKGNVSTVKSLEVAFLVLAQS